MAKALLEANLAQMHVNLKMCYTMWRKRAHTSQSAILKLGEYVVPARKFIRQREQHTARPGIAGTQTSLS